MAWAVKGFDVDVNQAENPRRPRTRGFADETFTK